MDGDDAASNVLPPVAPLVLKENKNSKIEKIKLTLLPFLKPQVSAVKRRLQRSGRGIGLLTASK